MDREGRLDCRMAGWGMDLFLATHRLACLDRRRNGSSTGRDRPAPRRRARSRRCRTCLSLASEPAPTAKTRSPPSSIRRCGRPAATTKAAVATCATRSTSRAPRTLFRCFSSPTGQAEPRPASPETTICTSRPRQMARTSWMRWSSTGQAV